jgi:succinyl-CoA synthetase beta subunit
MKLHEYQGKELFAKYGINTGQGQVINSIEELEKIKDSFGNKIVLKSQVHVGGRGKAGGIKVVDSSNAVEVAKSLLGMNLKGLIVKKLLIEKAIDIEKEYYLGIIQDRENKCITIMASAMGGVDIEEVAATNPEKIIKVSIDPTIGLSDFHVRNIVFGAEFPENLRNEAMNMIKNLYKLFVDNDCTLAEVNPLVITKNNELIAADAKVDMDDNADFRHKEWEEMKEVDETNKLEVLAKSSGLSYVELEGDIGCVVNGAGLAMATMDVIKYNGGKPANFLDIGGSSNPEKVVKAMNILMSKPIKAILFNIFGGITRCDDVAKGLLIAFQQLDVKVPVVIRLTGTNEDIARDMLEKAGYKVGNSMDDAVKDVVALANSKN